MNKRYYIYLTFAVFTILSFCFSASAMESGDQQIINEKFRPLSREEKSIDVINPEFKIVRESIYNYHINGMDNFYSDSNKSRLIILKSLEEINKINKNKFNSTIINIFLNAKSDELTNVFLNGSLDTKRNAYNILTELSPSRSDLFNKILE